MQWKNLASETKKAIWVQEYHLTITFVNVVDETWLTSNYSAVWGPSFGVAEVVGETKKMITS